MKGNQLTEVEQRLSPAGRGSQEDNTDAEQTRHQFSQMTSLPTNLLLLQQTKRTGKVKVHLWIYCSGSSCRSFIWLSASYQGSGRNFSKGKHLCLVLFDLHQTKRYRNTTLSNKGTWFITDIKFHPIVHRSWLLFFSPLGLSKLSGFLVLLFSLICSMRISN